MNLHRLNGGNDWDSIDPSERTPVQKLAAKTHGLVTPAHPITIGGGVLTEYGLSEIRNKRTLRGTALFLGGKACDFIDGWVADKRQVKSRVGRILDPTLDKIVAYRASQTLMDEDIVPASIGNGFLLQNGVNTAATLIATARGVISIRV